MKGQIQILGAMLMMLSVGACSRHKEASPTTAPASNPAQVAPAADPGVVEVPLSYELRLGQETFQHYCLICHGETGAGDGFNAYNLDPHPRDLSDPAFQKAKTDADLKDAIQRGGAGVGLSPLMPPWGRTLSPTQVDEVVLYLRTFKKTEP